MLSQIRIQLNVKKGFRWKNEARPGPSNLFVRAGMLHFSGRRRGRFSRAELRTAEAF